MTELQLADEILDKIREADGRYHERAYLFVLAALEYGQQQRPVRGHVSGQELAWACRDFAVAQFGLTARTVLKHWGLENTEDIGRIVFTLIEVGLFMKEESDQVSDFENVFDFAAAFDRDYPWAGVRCGEH
jgi:uncharacterized repeat protein (TIGR04138 family)